MCLQAIVRGSFIGHGDYISHVISEMSRLSAASSNSLRRSSPSARKRAQSLGRLGELAEGELYQYEEINHRSNSVKDGGGSTYWQDRIRQVRSESSSPKLNGAKSTSQVSSPPAATPPTPQRTGDTMKRYIHSEAAGTRQRPTSCLFNLQTAETSRAHLKTGAGATHLPDLLSSSKRPQSSYDLQVGFPYKPVANESHRS